ncbi:MAG: hypothetical protein AAF636_20435 [Pseudomonadota bacterium]
MPPAEGENPKGFFEDFDIYQFNEELLRALGSAWHSLTPLDEERLRGPDFSEHRRHATRLITEKLGTNEVFAFKDPRTAVLMPFWRCVFEDLELEDQYVLTVRNPMEIAASLNARDGFDMRHGLYLWAKHVVEAVRYTEGKPRVFVAYETVLREPFEQLTRLAAALDLEAPKRNAKAITEYCEEFLELGLRHNFVGSKELERSGLAPPFLLALDQWLRERVHAPVDDVHERDEAFRSDIEARLQDSTPLLVLSDVAFSDAARERAATRAAQDALSETEKSLTAAVSDRDRLRDDLRVKQDECEDIDRQRQEVQEALEALRRSNSEETGLLTGAREAAEAISRELEQKLTEREKALQEAMRELQALRRSNKEETELLTGALEEARGELQALLPRFADAQKSGETTEALVRDLQQQLALAESARDSVLMEVCTLKDQLSVSQKAQNDAHDAAETLHQRVRALTAVEKENNADRAAYMLARAEVNALRSSTSWRLSAPMRALGRIARSPVSGTKAVVLRTARVVWRRLPGSPEARGRLARKGFTVAPFLFFWTPQYKAWSAERHTRSASRFSSGLSEDNQGESTG